MMCFSDPVEILKNLKAKLDDIDTIKLSDNLDAGERINLDRCQDRLRDVIEAIATRCYLCHECFGNLTMSTLRCNNKNCPEHVT